MFIHRCVLGDKSATSGAVLCPSNKDSLRHIVGLRLNMEHEMQGSTSRKDLDEFASTSPPTTLDSESGKQWNGLKQTKSSKKHLDRSHGCDKSITNLLYVIESQDCHEIDDYIHSENSQDVGEVVANSTKVVRKQTREVKPMAKPVDIAGKTLFTSSLAELGLELVDLTHSNITTLTHLEIFLKSNLPSTDGIVVSRKNIFRKIDSL
mmetsp:Transcript_23393/g.39950  ORF Transcript_23393/g.39950 Transcript_23393/m.39950 type:complete len:207 (+) Transcript_23393:1557-2177(+)